MAAGSAGGSGYLALWIDPDSPGQPVAERSKLLAWIFCSSLLCIRDLARARSPGTNPSPAILVRRHHIAGGLDYAYRRPSGCGNLFGPLFDAVGLGWSCDPLDRMGSGSRGIVPLGLPVSDYPQPRHHSESDNLPSTVVGFA